MNTISTSTLSKLDKQKITYKKWYDNNKDYFNNYYHEHRDTLLPKMKEAKKKKYISKKHKPINELLEDIRILKEKITEYEQANQNKN